MRRLPIVRIAVVLLLASVVVADGRSFAAAGSDVTMAGFAYTPETLEIVPGTRVLWTNVDPTIHTVTADDGEFNSGQLRPGQQFALTFNRPGTFTYFCEPHEYMRASVVVLGAAGSSSDMPSGAPPPDGTAPPGDQAVPPSSGSAIKPLTTEVAATSAQELASGTGAPEAAIEGGSPAATDTDAGAAPMEVTARPTELSLPAVVDGQVVGTGTTALPPLPLGGGLVALSAVTALQLATFRRNRGSSVRLVGAALTAASAATHLLLALSVDYPEPIGTLFLAQAAVAAMAAAYLLAGDPAGRLVVVMVHSVTLVAFVLSRTVGVFGFRELGWDPAPHSALAAAAAVATIALVAIEQLVARVVPP